MQRFLSFVCPLVAILSTSAVLAADCEIRISYKVVDSKYEPRGDIDAILIAGAHARNTGGGKATSKERCIYLYGPDVKEQSEKPLYKGKVWPYVYAKNTDCDIVFDDTVSDDSRLREEGFITINKRKLLLFGGLPVYQYPDDGDLECHCNVQGEWSSVYEDGSGAALDDVEYPIDA